MSKSIRAVALLVALLAACGGGGSGSGADNGGASPGGGAPAPPDLQTSVSAPTYADGSGELVYFQFINHLRQQLGLGLLAQNVSLDAAAANHVAYLDPSFTDAEMLSGIEDSSKPNFTGVSAQDRCTHVGYAGLCAQADRWSEIYFAGHPSPYLGLLVLDQGARDIGMAMHSTFLFGGMSNGPEIQLGLPSGTTPQHQGSEFTLVAQLWGAFHVQVNEDEVLTVDTFRVADAYNHDIGGTIVTSATDPLQRVPANAAMFVPANPITCDGSTYFVSFTGKRGGSFFIVTRTITINPYPHCG